MKTQTSKALNSHKTQTSKALNSHKTEKQKGQLLRILSRCIS